MNRNRRGPPWHARVAPRDRSVRFAPVQGVSGRILELVGRLPLALGAFFPRLLARRMGAVPNPGSTLQSIRRGQLTEAALTTGPDIGPLDRHIGHHGGQPVGDLHIGGGMNRLHRSDHAKLCEARDILRMNDLGMLDAVRNWELGIGNWELGIGN